MTIGVTRSWRRKGLGAALLQQLRERLLAGGLVSSVYLHVQASNTTAMDFYLRHGFKVVKKEIGYYNFGPNDVPGLGQDHCPDAYYMHAAVDPSRNIVTASSPLPLLWCGWLWRLLGSAQ